MDKSSKSLCEHALDIIKEPVPANKVALARRLGAMWQDDRLGMEPGSCALQFPEHPGRPARPVLLPFGEMPKRRAGSKKGLIALVHSLVHIELNAIDMAFDLLARFANAPLPRVFVNEALKVGLDEADHFEMINRDLERLGASYGDLPAHGGLWSAVITTRDDLLARLAIVPLVLEARGLDVTPAMIKRVEKSGDKAIVQTMQHIYRDEITHVAFGAKWFKYICEQNDIDQKATFQALVAHHFKGSLKPPFNEQARTQAGMPKEFYNLPH